MVERGEAYARPHGVDGRDKHGHDGQGCGRP